LQKVFPDIDSDETTAIAEEVRGAGNADHFPHVVRCNFAPILAASASIRTLNTPSV
jgi:hypothetical protein